MSSRNTYPKRLIEVDLPIKRISAHARREKSIRYGHISTLHIWWARRPLAACRAVICASLWPDPVDVTQLDIETAQKEKKALELNSCPPTFRDAARTEMLAWTTHERQRLLSPESRVRFEKARQNPEIFSDAVQLRGALLDFIADFANWDNSTVREYLDSCRALTQAAHEALGGEPGTRPLVVDPFAGGGSIPLEVLRVGADVFASDLNPIPVLLNKVILEYIPKYGQHLSDEVRKWGEWIALQAEKELAEFYPRDSDDATPIAYLWARTIYCEGPGCGAEVPLLRSLWLAKKANRSVALQLIAPKNVKRVDFIIIVKRRDTWEDQADPAAKIESPKFDGTVKRGSATCPCCGYTTQVGRVREQLKARHGGANDSRLLCIVMTRRGQPGRHYRLPRKSDLVATEAAAVKLRHLEELDTGRNISLIPTERLDVRGIRHTWAMIYGLNTWKDHFTTRQLLGLVTLTRLVQEAGGRLAQSGDALLSQAVQTCLAFSVSKLADFGNSGTRWGTDDQGITAMCSRQAIPLVWDFAEPNLANGESYSWKWASSYVQGVIEKNVLLTNQGSRSLQASASHHPLPDDAGNLLFTDPPYYDAVPYAFLSDFFYVWLRRNLLNVHPDLLKDELVPKDAEIVVDRTHELSNSTHDIAFYERELTKAFGEGRRVLKCDGVGTIVFASKTTASWEAILKAVVDAGWTITGSWPIDTEMANRVSARGQARLASSVHLVCRPRESADGSVRPDDIGDWRDVLQELPRRIHEWMPRLAEEGVVGADAIFACLGPALEIFSRHSHVEKASGETVSLKEYLEQVWAAVSKEALAMIFTGADATGFEEDARLTAMWLWTLSTADSNGNLAGTVDDEDPGEEVEDDTANAKGKVAGFVLEYDAARKIAQGLGAHLELLASLIEVKGATARLLPVAERTRSLFQKGDAAEPTGLGRAKKKSVQLSLGFVADLEEAEASGGWGDTGAPHKGETVLDRVHQSMILFGAGRGEALKRFLVDDGAGRDDHFWRLAQALSALYPSSTDEKRWVDGVLARKKSLGF